MVNFVGNTDFSDMKKKQSNWPKPLLQWGTLAALIFSLSGLAGKIFPKMDAVDPERLCPF